MNALTSSKRLLQFVTPRIYRKAAGRAEVEIGSALGQRLLERVALERLTDAATRLWNDPAIAWAEARRGAQVARLLKGGRLGRDVDRRGREVADRLVELRAELTHVKAVDDEGGTDQRLIIQLSRIADSIIAIKVSLRSRQNDRSEVARDHGQSTLVGRDGDIGAAVRRDARNLREKVYPRLNRIRDLVPNCTEPEEFGRLRQS